MKVIYLDIDGVMNSPFDKEQESDMSIDKLKLLSEFMSKEGIDGIVITSDRRYSPFDMRAKIKTFTKYGIKVLATIRDATGEDDDSRGKQIYDSIQENKKDIDWFVILDDNDDCISKYFKGKFILIDDKHGFTDNVIARIKKEVKF